MPKYDKAVIEKYRLLLKKDPNSQAFAALADAHREAGDLILAEKIVREGLRRHPQFASGHVVLGRILKDQERHQESLATIKKAIEINSDNILAHQLEGDLLLELKRPQEALKSYKMVLFLNPQSTKARKLVQKLESLTAAEYDDDVFAMTKLESLGKPQIAESPSSETSLTRIKSMSESSSNTISRSLQRSLSLLDAFIIRNDLEKANELLKQAQLEFGSQNDLEKRAKILRSRTQSSLLSGSEQSPEALIIKPRMSRENEIQQRKLEKLQLLLRKVESLKGNEY